MPAATNIKANTAFEFLLSAGSLRELPRPPSIGTQTRDGLVTMLAAIADEIAERVPGRIQCRPGEQPLMNVTVERRNTGGLSKLQPAG